MIQRKSNGRVPKKETSWRVGRHANMVAVQLEGQEPILLSAENARDLADAIRTEVAHTERLASPRAREPVSSS
jgi:hypothetical protein